MKTPVFVSCPPELEKALAAHNLVLFVGAGISRLEPTGLPSWWEFNELLVKGAGAVALETIAGADDELSDDLRNLRLGGSVVAFSDQLVRLVTGEDYWPVLQALDSDKPNANHIAIASLAGKGIVKTVVTTNFDSLIERALRLAGVSFRVIVPQASDPIWADTESDECTVFKIHGSVSAEHSLIDTVSQKLRGLGLPVRTALNRLYHRHHVMAVGYSGADLDFGRDYLAFSGIDDNGQGITWVAPDGNVCQAVADVLARAGPDKGALWKCEFPAGWGNLGAATAPPLASRPIQLPYKALEARIVTMFKKHPVLTLLLCGELLLQRGAWHSASRLRRLIIDITKQKASHIPGKLDGVYLGLLTTATNYGGQSEIGAWLDLIAGLSSHGTPTARTLSAAEREDALVTEACLMNIRAGCYLNAGETDAAYTAWTRALELAQEACAYDVLAVVKLGWVRLMNRFNASPDDLIEDARKAITLALHGGNAKTAADACVEVASLLTNLCEYDAAARYLREAQAYGAMAPDPFRSVQIELEVQRIAVRRRDADAAADAYAAALKAATTPMLIATVKYASAEMLCFAVSFKGLACRLLREVEESMQAGEVPSDGSIPPLPSRETIAKLKQSIWETREQEHQPEFISNFPAFLSTFHFRERDPEPTLRQALLIAEYHHGSAKSVIKTLMKLSLLKLQAGRYARAFDLAQSCVFAADRLAVDESLQLMARQGLARVLTELGRHREAKAAIKEAMALSLASTNPEGRGLLLTDLGEIYRRTGDAQAAIPLLTEAVELLSPLQKHDATAYAVIRLADSHLSEGRFEVARKLLQRHQATLQRANDAKSQALIAHITAQLASDELSSTKAVPDATMSDVDIALRSRLTTDPGELLGLGRAATTGGHWSLAEEILDRCLERLGSDAPAASRVECHDALAILAAAMARGARLIEHRRQALRLIRKLGDDLEYLRRLCELVTEAVELHQLAGIGMDSHQLLELAATGGPSADTIRALYAAIMGFAAIGARSEVRKAALLMQEYCIKIPDFEGSGESLKVAQFALAETAASQKAR